MLHRVGSYFRLFLELLYVLSTNKKHGFMHTTVCLEEGLHKEMVCIIKPGFFLRGGIKYGPLFNELVIVEAVYQWSAYPEERYYQLKGWRHYWPHPNAMHPFALYRAVHFAEVMPMQMLEDLMYHPHKQLELIPGSLEVI
jgi:hypothetical protein